MGEQFRSAIIGIGPNTPGKGGAHSFAYSHANAYVHCPDTKLVAAVSRNPKNVSDFQNEFAGVQGFNDYHKMLAAIRPEIVSICAFPPDREAMVTAALEAGAKGIWIEKPFATSLGVARKLLALAKAKKARLFVNHQRRYGKPFEWLRAAVVEKKIGELTGFDIMQPFADFMNFGPHLIDAALFCLGSRQAVRVFAACDLTEVGNYQGVPVEKQLMASIHLSDGVRLTAECGQQACSKQAILRAHGSEGFAELHLDIPAGGQGIFRARYVGEAAVVNPPTNEHFHHSEDMALYVKRACTEIADVLRNGGSTRIDGEEALRGLEIIMAMYESARLRRMLALPLTQNEFPLALDIKERGGK